MRHITIEAVERMEAQAQASIDDRARRIDEGLTDMDDCFVSQRFNEQQLYEAHLWRDLIAHNGRAVFTEPVLLNLDGEIVSDEFKRGPYGNFFVVNGKCINPFVRPETLKKKGFVFSYYKYSAPACVRTSTINPGMFGAYTSTRVIAESDWNSVTNQHEEKEFISIEEYHPYRFE